MSGLVSYGGDVSVVASRSEIERIGSILSVVQQRIVDELQPLAQLHGVVHHLQLDAYIPQTLVRVGLQRFGCFQAAESYFTRDAQIAHLLDSIDSHLQGHQPAHYLSAVVGVAAVGMFTNTDASAQLGRVAIGYLPVSKAGEVLNALPEHSVHVTEVVPEATPMGTSSIGDLSSRLNNKSGNIRIEEYSTSNGTVKVVYLPGTSFKDGKVFSLRSDVELMANGQKANSYLAAEMAMKTFGIKETDRVILVGYSQGGMVAAELAQHHKNVTGLVTMGSPIATEAIPKVIPTLSLEHSNDIVPALSGKTNPLTENWATASRHVDLKPGQNAIEAHEIENYVETAKLADASADSGLVRVRQNLLGQLANSKLLRYSEYQALEELH